MAVYNDIQHDGRVARAAEALAGDFSVTVLSTGSCRNCEGDPFEHMPATAALRSSRSWARLGGFWMDLARASLRTRPSILYANDYYLALPGLVAARTVGACSVYDAHELIVREGPQRPGTRDRLFQVGERLAVGRCDLVIAANRERAALMRQHYRLPDTPVVIRNIPPQPRGQVCPETATAKYPSLRRTGRARLIYQGDVSFARGLERFVDAVALLADRCEILVVGGGPDYPKLERVVSSGAPAGHLILLGKVPRADLPSIMATADIGIVCYASRGLNNIYCAPNKIYEYAQAGLPVVATDQSPLRTAVEGYGIGVTCPSAEDTPAAEIASRIASLLSGAQQCRDNLARFLQDHQWDGEAQRLRQAVGALTAPRADT